MVGCLVVGHGNIAQSIVDASRRIAGECDQVFTISCGDLAPKQFYTEIVHLIESENLEDGLFILVSLRGGSFWNTAMKIAKHYEKVEIISGLNLSILLSFITKKNKYSFHELGKVMVADGIRGINQYGE